MRSGEVESQPEAVCSNERVAYGMRALGKRGLPPFIHLGPIRYELVRCVKHDFFAATGFYDDPQGNRVVLKISRTEEFAGVPLLWLGRWLCARERRFYRVLCDLPEVPAVLGKLGPAGMILEYVKGAPLSDCRRVPDGFFRRLEDLMERLHQRGIAYVDTNKTQNILVGTDEQPHLIDFQISYSLSDIGDRWLGRWILRHLQQSDIYHVLKHKRRLRPDELTPRQREQSGRRAWPIRLHRFLVKPYFGLRRRTFQRLRATGRLLPEGSK